MEQQSSNRNCITVNQTDILFKKEQMIQAAKNELSNDSFPRYNSEPQRNWLLYIDIRTPPTVVWILKMTLYSNWMQFKFNCL